MLDRLQCHTCGGATLGVVRILAQVGQYLGIDASLAPPQPHSLEPPGH